MIQMKPVDGRLPGFADIVRRFPVTVAVLVITTLWFIYAMNTSDVRRFRLFGFFDGNENLIGGLVLAAVLSVIGRLVGEARDWPDRKAARFSIILAAPAFLLLILGDKLYFNAVFAIGAAVLFLGSAAAWQRPRDDAAVRAFTRKLWTGAIFAAVGGLIFAVGLYAIVLSTSQSPIGRPLFVLTLKVLMPIGLTFLVPLFWLGTLPRFGEVKSSDEPGFETRFFPLLGRRIFAPLVLIYGAILLAYIAMIPVQFKLPEGKLAELTTPFLGFGMLVWLMLEPSVARASKFTRRFRAAWHWAMLPVAVLLGIAVFIRIHAYGFTPQRFVLVLLVIWTFVQSFWFIVRPAEERDIRIPTSLAAGLLMAAAFLAGPYSVQSQYKRALSAKAELASFRIDLNKTTAQVRGTRDFSSIGRTAVTANDQAASFDGEEVRTNAQAAREFRESLKYLVDVQAERKFKALLPNYNMPESTSSRGNWERLLVRLNLKDERLASYSRSRALPYPNRAPRLSPSSNANNYALVTERPIPVTAGSSFYGSYLLSINPIIVDKTIQEGVIFRDGFKTTFDLDGRRFTVDFKPVLEAIQIDRQDKSKPILIPVQAVPEAPDIKMIILSGNLRPGRSSSDRSGNLEVAFIVPN